MGLHIASGAKDTAEENILWGFENKRFTLPVRATVWLDGADNLVNQIRIAKF